MNSFKKVRKNRSTFAIRAFLFFLPLCLVCAGFAALVPECEAKNGVVYGTRAGKELKIDVLTPVKPNGAAVATIVSGDWISPEKPLLPILVAPFLSEGFTVFAIHHISQPQATVMETVEDVRRAIRFIRLHAAEYGVDPEKIGITGASSGGHLALMVAAGPWEGNPAADDPIDRESCAVKTAAVFFPLTDLVDMGKSKLNLGDGGPPAHFAAAFGMEDRDPEKWKPIALSMSPVFQVTEKMPPVLICHGTSDAMIPIEQSRRFRDAMTALGRDITLTEKEGQGHGWLTMPVDMKNFAAWFAKRL